ncbi:hypothetical protein S40288_09571 [Stachybotrys chartarum IBT 40288]|nr:hypothetical protein S40288_09571 [Stachybotrys chartarum IBT 40288]
MATTSSYFGAATGRRPDSDRVILAPSNINPRPNDPDGVLIEPDEFKLNGKQFVRYSVVAKSQNHTKKRTSVVWQYGEDIQLKQDPTKRFWETGEHRHAKRHPSQPSTVDFNNISTLVFKRRFDGFKELLIRWIVYCHIAFFQIDNLYFRELLFYVFPGLTTLLPKARLVIRRWIIEAFEARKDSLRQEMQATHSNISISFDLWTSPNYQAILGCVAHFINRSGKRRKVVLALRELVGEHSGENMADVLLHIFDDYGISGRIGYFMADNASSNDACIDLVLQALYPNMSRKHRVRRRLRCFGHIVNLCAQAFIMGKDAAKTCKDLDSAYREGDYTRIRELWKKRGAIGRLHNIVRYIRASPQRRQFFRSIQIGGDLAAFDGLEIIFQSLDWLMDEIHLARRKFEQLAEDALRKRGPNRQDKQNEFDDYNWLAAAAEVAWQKCEKYYNKADESPAYYAAILSLWLAFCGFQSIIFRMFTGTVVRLIFRHYEARYMRRVWGSHSGDNQATTIYDIFGEYGIRDRICAGVSDNVTSNDTCLASLYRQLSPAMAEEDIRNHRTRCFGHIINLVARAFLWGGDPDSFEREAFTEAAFQVEERELRLWRKRGAVGKLHNIVRFVRGSPQRPELMKSLACNQGDEDGYRLFEEERAAIDLELMRNNETRWNSTFLMIQRAIRKREHINHFITYLETKAAEPRQRVPVQDQLSPLDWLLLAEIQSLLKPLYEITMRCQGWAKEGRYGALWEVMIGMEHLLNFFEEQKLIFSPPGDIVDELRNVRASATTRCSIPRVDQGRGREKHLLQHIRDEYTGAFLQTENFDDDHRRCIQISINNCWSKLDKYYSLLDQSPLYPAAAILHPRWNVSWLEANWTSHEQLVWLRDAKNSVREFFEQQYPRKEQSETARTMIGKAIRQDEASQFDQWMQSYDRYMMEEEDELGVYMRQGPVRRENLNPILWWKDQQEEYPRLSKFALDILAIPAMSVDPERTFSVTKLTVSSQRHSLSPEIIKEIQCLRNWLGHQAITVGEVVSFGGDLMGWDGGEA